jgi:hypothetical protein
MTESPSPSAFLLAGIMNADNPDAHGDIHISVAALRNGQTVIWTYPDGAILAEIKPSDVPWVQNFIPMIDDSPENSIN